MVMNMCIILINPLLIDIYMYLYEDDM